MVRVVLILGLLVGCQSSLPTATAIDASRARVELADLQHGRSLVVSKCGGCHRPPQPSEHRANEWPGMLDEMAARANLDFMQRRLIEGYLVTMAMR